MDIEQRQYDGSPESRRSLTNWMVESAKTGNYHHVGESPMTIHPGDTVFRTQEGGFGTICPHLRWNAGIANVVWR